MGQRSEVQPWGDLVAFSSEEAVDEGVDAALDSPKGVLGVGVMIGVVVMASSSRVEL